jgi:hypothetical protein
VQKVDFLHSRSVGSDRQRDRLKAMQVPLRESKCENMADVTSFCMGILTDSQLDRFEELGRNSHHGVWQRSVQNGPNCCSTSTGFWNLRHKCQRGNEA